MLDVFKRFALPVAIFSAPCLQTLSLYAAFCTLVVFAVHFCLFVIPGPGYFIMHTILGLSDELARLCLTPLKIFAGLCLCGKCYLPSRSYNRLSGCVIGMFSISKHLPAPASRPAHLSFHVRVSAKYFVVSGRSMTSF